MYEVWDNDRIVYISSEYRKAWYFWLAYTEKYKIGRICWES